MKGLSSSLVACPYASARSAARIGSAPELRVVTEGMPLEQLGTEPLDLAEGPGAAASLEPPSLYEAQRARRLGP